MTKPNGLEPALSTGLTGMEPMLSWRDAWRRRFPNLPEPKLDNSCCVSHDGITWYYCPDMSVGPEGEFILLDFDYNEIALFMSEHEALFQVERMADFESFHNARISMSWDLSPEQAKQVANVFGFDYAD